ncbi:phosphate signaling complex PhoU family protein [Crenothrix polyspora]|uniref:Putative Phosphate-specific transport system accessory protein PhoU homolog n=1 Tax=Crenothrix polyspora TaxID=360316 RepID=A0A1R4HIR4_9GAMM|nr:PhoU domain-containing protein [Crenothrix polyspora]SJM95901.1 putative Phosphate-specific transport system accessory protein PhoU homolog [Crenothrix polyspora]
MAVIKIVQPTGNKAAIALDGICHQVLALGELVEQQMDLAMMALTKGDFKAAKKSFNLMDQINSDKASLDHQCYQMLALNQLGGFDLKLLITVIKIIHELKLIGQLTEAFAKMAIQFSNDHGIPSIYHEIETLFNRVKERLQLTLDVFSKIIIIDIAVTHVHKNDDCSYTMFLQLTTQIMNDANHIKRNLRILSMAKTLERIGDHAFHIYKELEYLTRSQYTIEQ